MSIEKTISPTLSNLIAEANYTIESVKEKILAAYNYAVEKDGYTPIEAAKVLRDNLEFSDSYIRKVLPLESKQTEKTRDQSAILVAQKSQENNENVENITTKDESIENIPERPIPEIKTAYDIKEAESEPIDESYNVTSEQLENSQTVQIMKLQDQIDRLTKQNQELEIKLRDNAFDEIRNTSKDSIKTGIYDLEIKDRIIPLKWNYAPTINRMVIELDVNRARRMGI